MKYITPEVEIVEVCTDTPIANENEETEVVFPMAGLLSAGSMPK